MKVSVLGDPSLDLQQRWLDGYQLEVYLLIKLLKLGYYTTEVPVRQNLSHQGDRQHQDCVRWLIGGTC